MRSRLSELSFLPLAAGLLTAGLAASGLAAPAHAGGGHDRIYADSFGNLIVHSRTGYKRIVVGQGHLAGELAAYEQGRQRHLGRRRLRQRRSRPYECWKPAVAAEGPQLHVRP